MFLKKSLGQHLLVAEPTLEKIARTLNPSKDDIVLEIGPGTGRLTKHLAEFAGKVIAIEKDADMVKELKIQCSKFQNIEIIRADFLDFDLTHALTHPSTSLRAGLNTHALFCGNLPYNISTPILFKIRDNKKLFSRGVVTVQKEVALRLTAKPGTKDYGVLSILMQSDAKIKKCFDISPRSFLPPPKVWSSIVSMEFPETPPYDIKDKKLFEGIVKKVFQQRRKMINNSLSKDHLNYLVPAGILPTERPEVVPIEKFALLSNLINSQRQAQQ